MKRKGFSIGVYADPIFEKRTGVGNYIFNLCKALFKILPEAQFFLVCQKAPKEIPFPNKENLSIVVERESKLKVFPRTLWFRFFSSRLFENLKVQVFWSGLPIIPRGLRGIRKVLTVHDLNYYIVPETMKLRTRLSYRFFFRKSLLEADSIVSVSQGTAERLNKLFKIKVDAVVHPGIDPNIFKPLDKRNVRDFLQRKGLKFNYIFSVSTLEPRKNLNSLIDAFLELKAEGKLRRYKLVLAGDRGWKSSNVKRKLRRFSSEIVYLGYVPERELPFLYNGASLFILPSIYEGFGMPAQEARACGCCVMVSDIPELHESAGPGAIYVKPTKEGLKEALSLFEKGKLSCDKKRLREGLFLWEEEAKKLAEVLIK